MLHLPCGDRRGAMWCWSWIQPATSFASNLKAHTNNLWVNINWLPVCAWFYCERRLLRNSCDTKRTLSCARCKLFSIILPASKVCFSTIHLIISRFRRIVPITRGAQTNIMHRESIIKAASVKVTAVERASERRKWNKPRSAARCCRESAAIHLLFCALGNQSQVTFYLLIDFYLRPIVFNGMVIDFAWRFLTKSYGLKFSLAA